jgi:uncharacterized membrane protein
MESFALVVLIVVLVLRWAVLRNRMQNLEDRIEQLTLGGSSSQRDEIVAGLIRRVHALETAGVQAPPVVPEPEPVVVETVPEPSGPPPLPIYETPVEPKPIPAVELPIPEPVFRAVAEEPEPPSLADEFGGRVRRKMGGQEWEALVGGNWMNKAGVLVLVIGIAFLISYGFTQTGPFGRVAIGVLVSLAMLGTGIAFERKEAYRIFGRGLIGGGWAALYFTAYALYAIDAAKVIDDPLKASVILLAVAAAMIVHSLRYRSQTVTGLAYFIAFATLMLSEVTPFAVMALIPLAASLLYTAYRFSWFTMAVFGLFATWGTLISRGDSGAPLSTSQAVFAAFWLLFEIFDLMRTIRRDENIAPTQFILPINAAAFVPLSWHKWETVAAIDQWKFFAAAGAAYLLSALLRAKVRPPSSFADENGTLSRFALGGYEGPVTLSALLIGLAIFLKAPTIWINVGWLIEGELLFLAGLRFGERYLRGLSAGAFLVSIAKLGFIDVPAAGTMTMGSLHLRVWSPVAFAHAVAFYLNRILRKSAREYSWAAAAVLVAMLCAEVPSQYLAVALLIYGAALFELGLHARLAEFRYQSYFAGVLGVVLAGFANVLAPEPGWKMEWLPLAICTAISYAAAIRIRGSQTDRLDDWEVRSLRQAGSCAATFLAMAVVWELAPGDYLALVWIALGAMLFELGMRGFPEEIRWTSYAASAIGVGRLLVLNVIGVTKAANQAERISLLCGALICYAIAARVFRAGADRERAWARDLNSIAATSFLLAVAWVVLPDAVVALAWAAVGLLLLEIGFWSSLTSFRLQGNLVSKLVFFRLFFANFTDLGHTGWFSHRLLTVLPIIVSEYYISRRYQDVEVSEGERNASRLYQYAATILAVVLSRFELGRALTVTGWAGITLALFVLGVRRKDLHLRWQSYLVAGLAFWRCWNTNFYIPESLAGLPGRVFTGGLVVACLYAAQVVAPREGAQGTNLWQRLDQYSRLLFCLLASTLLAVMLFYEVSGGILTVAWTTQAMAMLVAGFPLRDRTLRLSGLFLFFVCILKVFLWDLRHLETLQRILSFIVLGLILVGVSWMYTRFRERIQRYL